MKSICFKNFRRFKEFSPFEFGDITILVGGNNAGKSTLQKALLLVFDNLITLNEKVSTTSIFEDGFNTPRFRFDTNQFHDLNLGTFRRALYSGAENKKMEFGLCINDFEILVEVEPDATGEDMPMAKVSWIQINDMKRSIRYLFDFNTRRMRVEFKSVKSDSSVKFDEVQVRIAELTSNLNAAKVRSNLGEEDDLLAAVSMNQELERLMAVREALAKSRTEEREASTAEADLNNYLGLKGENRLTSLTLPGYIENLEAYTSTIGAQATYVKLEEDPELEENSDEEEDTNEKKGKINFSKEDRMNLQVLADKGSLLLDSAKELQKELDFHPIDYIQAHGVAQKMLYTLDDKNDFMVQAIHKYARFGVKPDTFADHFIRTWMKEFGIGSNYQIQSFGGEGYIMKVETANGWVNLADMGMGTNQLMLLLLNLATIMLKEGHHGATGGKSYRTKLIVIEEPEQNLHPRLQSKLADLLAEVAKDESYKFLIETHSEYLIRRTQAIVAQLGATDNQELKMQNPFKVYYFPEEGVPYDMEYTLSGRFGKKFGEGFFDESAKWHLEVLRREKESK
jgi:predicted ATP-dependent endonuclease of OLD family